MSFKHMNDASQYLEEGKPDIAAAYRSELHKLYQKLGDVLAEIGDREQAAVAYRNAIEINPKEAINYSYIGKKLTKIGAIDEAVTCWEKAVEIDPNNSVFNNNLGEVLAKKGDLDEAIACYRWAIKLEPNYDSPHRNLGEALAKKGDMEAAIAAYRRAIELNPECENSHYQLGETLVKLNRVEEAIAAYRRAIAIKADWAQAYFSLGNALEKFKCGAWQMDETIACWLWAFSLKPDWSELQQKIELTVAFMQWQPHGSQSNRESLTKGQPQSKGNQPLAKLGIRFVSETWVQAIGHFRNLEIYAKMVTLGWMPKYCFILLESKVANACYLNYWRQQGAIKFICDPHLISLLSPLASKGELRDIDWYPNISVSLPNGQRFFRPNVPVEKQWEAENRPPLLTLSDTHREQGWRCLQELGVPKDAWFVNLHVREDGFYNQQGRGAPRNADIDTYLLAIDTIAARGGWVIRTGDPSMKPLPAKEHAIDYALCDKRSDWMDVFLWAECHLFVGTTSGPIHIPPTFGVPTVMTN